MRQALLFAGGVCMGYFMTIPVAITFMLRVNGWLGVTCSFVELADYVSFVLRLLIAFGLAFELPVVVLALDLVDAAGMLVGTLDDQPALEFLLGFLEQLDHSLA